MIAYPHFSISEKTLIGHFLKGVMFSNHHLMDQTMRKNHKTYDGRGGAAKVKFSKSAPGLYVLNWEHQQYFSCLLKRTNNIIEPLYQNIIL